MKTGSRISLFAKLLGGFMSITLLLLMFSLYAVNQLRSVGGYFEKAYTEAVVPLDEWSRFQINVHDINGLLNYHIAEQDLENQERIEQDLFKLIELMGESLIKLGVDTVSEDEFARIEDELEKGIDYTELDFGGEVQARLLAVLKFHWNRIVNMSQKIIEDSKSYMKEDAACPKRKTPSIPVLLFWN